MRITAVTCVKNEGPFLLEWIAFNRMIGVTDHLFYSNDCTDGTDTLLDALDSRGIVQHLPNPARGRNYQMEALRDSRKQAVVREADWVWVADVDEFLNIHVGDGTIPELVTACGNPSVISLNWQFFANSDVEEYEDRPVIEQFLGTHNPDVWSGTLSIETKSLYRGDTPIAMSGAHRPFLRERLASPDLPKNKRLRWTDGSGRPVPDKYFTAEVKREFPARGSRNFASVNHYALRSLDSYLVKNDRGDVNRENRNFDDTYWRERNDDAYEESSILRHLPKLQKEIAALKSDPEIAKLHDAAVAAHRATLARLMDDSAYRKLREQLKAASKIPPQEEALIAVLNK
ncbi:glycosyltransferase family 2 protein [Actibacterium lipolyticum]|nr:glycosyltransferase family 2 protein [Actibacterium lipolyticum]